jgi:acylphosphatase
MILSTNADQKQVEGEAQGPEETLQKFLKDVDKGPRSAHVVKLEKKILDVRDDDDDDGHFGVRRTSESLFESS